jgi:hypothetical protein
MIERRIRFMTTTDGIITKAHYDCEENMYVLQIDVGRS